MNTYGFPNMYLPERERERERGGEREGVALIFCNCDILS